MEFLIYLVLGAIAGLAAGLLGIGGGLVIVAPLAFLLEARGVSAAVAIHVAVATALATIVVTSLSSAWAHHRRGAVRWSLVQRLAPAMALGSVAGAQVVVALPARGLEVLVGAVAAAAGFKMLVGLTPVPGRAGGTPLLAAAGLVIGAVSAVAGIGGGVMTVPLLVWWRVAMGEAVATSAALGFPIAAAGTAALVLIGSTDVAPPAGTAGLVYWPAAVPLAAASVLTAPLGARLAHRLPARTLAQVFGVLLLGVAGHLWLA